MLLYCNFKTLVRTSLFFESIFSAKEILIINEFYPFKHVAIIYLGENLLTRKVYLLTMSLKLNNELWRFVYCVVSLANELDYWYHILVTIYHTHINIETN